MSLYDRIVEQGKAMREWQRGKGNWGITRMTAYAIFDDVLYRSDDGGPWVRVEPTEEPDEDEG